MKQELDNLFLFIKNRVYFLIQDYNIDIDLLAFDLKMDRDTFIENFTQRIDDFNFYLQTLSLVENWEG